MVAPVLGLPALLKTLGTLTIGGAAGYKAQKDLQPLIKELKASPEDMDSSELKMLRALLMPSQAVGSQIKEDLIKRSVGTTGEGAAIGPRAEDIERVQEEIREVSKPPVTKTPVKPITTETFPIEPPIKQEPPVQPDIDLDTKETTPDQSEKLNIPIITYSKDVPKDFKDLAKRSVGRDKGTEAVDALFDDNIFSDVLDSDQVARIRQLEDQYVGDIMDKGDPAVPIAFTNSTVKQYEDYFEDYKGKLEEVAREKLGDEFPMFRLMNKQDALKMLKDQELPDIKVQNEEGEIVPFTINMFGKETPYSQESMSFSLNPRTALSFKEIFHSDKPDEDYVLLEYKANPSDIVMRGHMSEADLVLNMGEAVGSPSSFKVYDFKYVKDGGKIKGLNVSLNKEFDEFVNPKQKVEAPAIVGTKAQEGGKQIKDITAGFSIQKDIVPSLLEQGKAAIPMKNFFEKDTNVINYKVGDTIGAYGGDVERSLDIEANVKPDFNIDNFSEVIKQGAKEYNQDAVFVAESAPPEKANTVGFSIDFGSNLNIADALEVSKRISDTAQLDGFTFKVKNLDTSGASIYLPQEKDLEMTQKVMDKFQPTDQINLAGFMMPDGKMLNFSRSGNVRDTEHRRIGLTTHPGSDGISFGPMYDFMNKTGAIRLAGNTNRLYAEISGKPSTTQIRKIAEEYNKNRDRYDSLTIALAIPKTEGALGGVKPEEAIDLSKMTYRLPNEAFIEINGTEANANDIFKKFQAADVMGKTFTGIRQLNIPEFSGMSPDEAAQKIINLGNNMSKVIEETGIKTLDKPKTKSYNVKLFQKGKDY